MSVLIKLCISVILSVYISNAHAQKLRKDTYESVPKLIASSGYPVEKHRVVTEDGYILQMHRIPAGRRTPRRTSSARKGKRAVLVIHGLLGSSGDFIIMGPQRSLGYLLADAGYDVWLGNLRGNYYTSHKNLTRNNPDFWEYSFHEHGKLDIPVMIDHILNVTGLEKVTYVGYSMGTTSFFTMMAQRPEYNDKVTSFFALAPAVYLDNIKQLALLLLKTVDVPKTMQSRGMISATLQPELIRFLVDNVCNFKYPQQDMCSSIIFSIVGEDYEQNDLEMQYTIISRMQPASWRQLQHFGKIAITGEFTSWEDGLWGCVRPYNLNNVKVPVTLLYGENDQLTEKHQVMRLAKTLKQNGVLEEMRPGCSWPKFNHLDFVFAKDVGSLVNEPLIKMIDNMFNKYYGDNYVCVLLTSFWLLVWMQVFSQNKRFNGTMYSYGLKV